jgi:hypothetical protein
MVPFHTLYLGLHAGGALPLPHLLFFLHNEPLDKYFLLCLETKKKIFTPFCDTSRYWQANHTLLNLTKVHAGKN